jgi:hypothetical protein
VIAYANAGHPRPFARPHQTLLSNAARLVESSPDQLERRNAIVKTTLNKREVLEQVRGCIEPSSENHSQSAIDAYVSTAWVDFSARR